jgi:DNA polymerase (family X)
MKNQKVATILHRIADYLEMDGTDFRTKAYRRAAHTVESLSTDIEGIRAQGKLQELPGIGTHIAIKIEEILDTGSLQYYEELKQKFPLDYEALLSVEGIGPKTIKQLYQELGVKNLDDLEREAKRHHIHRLKGLGMKTEQKILQNLEFSRKNTGRRLLGQVLPMAREMKHEIEKLPMVEQVEIAGSIRRRKETVGDVDILTITNQPQKVMEFFTKMERVDEVIAKGPSKSTVRLVDGMEVDLRVFQEEVFGSAMVYFTGSKEMNIELRKIAIQKGLKLNEYGVFRDEEQMAGHTEEDVFRVLGLDYIEPELRENMGELEAARTGKLPQLIEKENILGDLHMHTTWSDGKSEIRELATSARERGYEYIAITDHSGSLPVSSAMDKEQIQGQMKEIDSLNQEINGITILKGIEVNITSLGKLDIPYSILEEMDLVVAAVHAGQRSYPDNLTDMVLGAMENEYVDIIAHPTGRKIQERLDHDLNLERVFQMANDTGTFLEVNSQPDRLDLRDIHVKKALEYSCQLAVNTDAHRHDQLGNMELGVATVRRGWAQKKDIVNTLPLKKLLKVLK